MSANTTPSPFCATLNLLPKLQHFLARQLSPPLSRGKLPARFVEYLEEHATVLGMAPSTATAPSTSTKHRGRNTLVYKLQSATQGTLFARAWRYDLLQRPAGEHRIAGELFAAAGRNVPRLVMCDDTFATLRRWRLECAIECAASGVPVAALLEASQKHPPPPLLAALAAEIAALHRYKAHPPPAWGKPWRPVNELADPLRYWRGRLEKIGARITAGSQRLSHDRITRGIQGLIDQLPLLKWPSRPALVHGDLAPWHLYMADSRAATAASPFTWIDFGTVHWGHPALDLAAVRGWFPRLVYEDFLAAYAAAGGTRLAYRASSIHWFRRVRQLEKLSTRIVKRDASGRAPSARRRSALEQEHLEKEVEKWL